MTAATTPFTVRDRRRVPRYSAERLSRRAGIVWRPDGFPVMQSVLKPGTKGKARVSHFTISVKEADEYNFRIAFTAGTGMMRVEPGKYVRLHTEESGNSNPMMSDTQMERQSNWEIRKRGHGRVLVAGLGIGLILHPLLDPTRAQVPKERWQTQLPPVDHVTVVELSQDVIDLVGPSLARYGDRITIVQGDINEFNPGKEKFDTVYFDIWPTISEDNLPEIAKLHQRWKSRLNRSGEHKPFMSSWMVDHLRAMRRENNRYW